MTNYTADTSKHKAARIAGSMYLFTIIGSLLAVTFVFNKLIVPGNLNVTTKNIMENELLFHTGITFELIMSA